MIFTLYPNKVDHPQHPRPVTNDPYEHTPGAGVLPAGLAEVADRLEGASKEDIVAEALRMTPHSPHIDTTIGNLMVMRALRRAEKRSGRNLSDYQQQAL
ncbi:hypothetical protein MNEG_7768 [Monoraphidium neglectum]|uniref:Uncharacterized protein n=1 Tax=Monoraphidium neglectum TaxID=145388 RepID=A0A0D2KY98_9CHLO|nr:hypothetical protein MNEG_7768 [Monoraphidium neglectum]KIZ00194.1 hypothetical protein MNEG_7768 [Monoraphidium neglectum]|eukprot:XP_013899213.1 hypothetical protein MNEG_7768 [Monoraphidium neglectum]